MYGRVAPQLGPIRPVRHAQGADLLEHARVELGVDARPLADLERQVRRVEFRRGLSCLEIRPTLDQPDDRLRRGDAKGGDQQSPHSRMCKFHVRLPPAVTRPSVARG